MYLINSKRIWPLYIPPMENELFSSWFCRLSASHLVKNHTFAVNYFIDYMNLWTRDIDLLAPISIIDTINNHTPLSLSEINSMFLKSYESILFDKINPNSFTSGILPLGIHHRKRTNLGLMYCPGCLSQDIPYYRKQWRFALSLVCSNCKVRLLDSCNICKSPITYHRINFSNNQSSILNPIKLNFCVCGNDLTKNITDNEPNSDEIQFQNFIDNTISNGYNQYTQYSFLFFEVFYILLRKLSCNGKNTRFKKGIENYLNIRIPETLKRDFTLWSIEERREYIPKLHKLFLEYPSNMNFFFKSNKIPRTSVKNEGIIPYWFQKYAFDLI